MDFDSFVVRTKTDDLIKDLNNLQEEKDLFDFNKNDTEHPF